MYLHFFEKLNAWQESLDLVEAIYRETKNFPKRRNLG
ncbi:MAG: four helix bundle protein [Mangrovimonas sp.]|nr:four helix bundle protein [Mangrovimonas sp.]